MTDEERKKDYEETANKVWVWELAGEDLFKAASCLRKINKAKVKRLTQKMKNDTLPEKIPFSWLGSGEPERYLWGKCLEVYIKGIYIKHNKRLTDGNGNLKVKHHKLNQLCDGIGFNRNKSEQQTLDRLTDAVEFWGTYPVPSKYLKWKPSHNRTIGIPPIYTWDNTDDKNLEEVIKRIKLIINK